MRLCVWSFREAIMNLFRTKSCNVPCKERQRVLTNDDRSVLRGGNFCTKPRPTQENRESGGVMEGFQNSLNLTELWKISKVGKNKGRKNKVGMARSLKA